MPPKNNKPATTSSPRITAAERGQLVESIAEHTIPLQEAHSNAINWEAASRYIGLVGMMGYLSSDGLAPKHVAHTRKMIAHEFVAVPKDGSPVRGRAGLLRVVSTEVAAEIAEIQGFEDNADKMSRPYKNAQEDLGQLSGLLDPVVLALKKSLRTSRTKR